MPHHHDTLFRALVFVPVQKPNFDYKKRGQLCETWSASRRGIFSIDFEAFVPTEMPIFAASAQLSRSFAPIFLTRCVDRRSIIAVKMLHSAFEHGDLEDELRRAPCLAREVAVLMSRSCGSPASLVFANKLSMHLTPGCMPLVEPPEEVVSRGSKKSTNKTVPEKSAEKNAKKEAASAAAAAATPATAAPATPFLERVAATFPHLNELDLHFGYAGELHGTLAARLGLGAALRQLPLLISVDLDGALVLQQEDFASLPVGLERLRLGSEVQFLKVPTAEELVIDATRVDDVEPRRRRGRHFTGRSRRSMVRVRELSMETIATELRRLTRLRELHVELPGQLRHLRRIAGAAGESSSSFPSLRRLYWCALMDGKSSNAPELRCEEEMLRPRGRNPVEKLATLFPNMQNLVLDLTSCRGTFDVAALPGDLRLLRLIGISLIVENFGDLPPDIEILGIDSVGRSSAKLSARTFFETLQQRRSLRELECQGDGFLAQPSRRRNNNSNRNNRNNDNDSDEDFLLDLATLLPPRLQKLVMRDSFPVRMNVIRQLPPSLRVLQLRQLEGVRGPSISFSGAVNLKEVEIKHCGTVRHVDLSSLPSGLVKFSVFLVPDGDGSSVGKQQQQLWDLRRLPRGLSEFSLWEENDEEDAHEVLIDTSFLTQLRSCKLFEVSCQRLHADSNLSLCALPPAIETFVIDTVVEHEDFELPRCLWSRRAGHNSGARCRRYRQCHNIVHRRRGYLRGQRKPAGEYATARRRRFTRRELRSEETFYHDALLPLLLSKPTSCAPLEDFGSLKERVAQIHRGEADVLSLGSSGLKMRFLNFSNLPPTLRDVRLRHVGAAGPIVLPSAAEGVTCLRRLYLESTQIDVNNSVFPSSGEMCIGELKIRGLERDESAAEKKQVRKQQRDPWMRRMERRRRAGWSDSDSTLYECNSDNDDDDNDDSSCSGSTLTDYWCWDPASDEASHRGTDDYVNSLAPSSSSNSSSSSSSDSYRGRRGRAAAAKRRQRLAKKKPLRTALETVASLYTRRRLRSRSNIDVESTDDSDESSDGSPRRGRRRNMNWTDSSDESEESSDFDYDYDYDDESDYGYDYEYGSDEW